MYPLEIKERALKMIQEAYSWYEEEKEGLGEDLLSVLDTVYQRITAHPEYFSIIEKKYRQVKIPRFPYVVVYEVIKGKVVVFAVFHISRNPKSKLKDKK